jgi:hypothetical protein
MGGDELDPPGQRKRDGGKGTLKNFVALNLLRLSTTVNTALQLPDHATWVCCVRGVPQPLQYGT